MKVYFVEFVDGEFCEVLYKCFTDLDAAKKFVEEDCKNEHFVEYNPEKGWSWKHISAQPEYDSDPDFPTNGERYIYKNNGEYYEHYTIYGCDLVEVDG